MIDLIIAYLALIVVVLLLIIVFLTVYIVHERRKSSDQVFKTTEEKKVLVPVFTWRHNVGPSGDHRKLSKRVRCRPSMFIIRNEKCPTYPKSRRFLSSDVDVHQGQQQQQQQKEKEKQINVFSCS